MSDKPERVLPTLHLNGSGYKDLAERYRKGIAALRSVWHNLPAPHPRDYLETEDYEQAMAQYNSQRERVTSVAQELEEDLAALRRQERARR